MEPSKTVARTTAPHGVSESTKTQDWRTTTQSRLFNLNYLLLYFEGTCVNVVGPLLKYSVLGSIVGQIVINQHARPREKEVGIVFNIFRNHLINSRLIV